MLNGIPWYIWLCVGSIVGFVIASKLTNEFARLIERDNLRLQGVIYTLRQKILKDENKKSEPFNPIAPGAITSAITKLDPFKLEGTKGE